jgi:hypothetical protein
MGKKKSNDRISNRRINNRKGLFDMINIVISTRFKFRCYIVIEDFTLRNFHGYMVLIIRHSAEDQKLKVSFVIPKIFMIFRVKKNGGEGY